MGIDYQNQHNNNVKYLIDKYAKNDGMDPEEIQKIYQQKVEEIASNATVKDHIAPLAILATRRELDGKKKNAENLEQRVE